MLTSLIDEVDAGTTHSLNVDCYSSSLLDLPIFSPCHAIEMAKRKMTWAEGGE